MFYTVFLNNEIFISMIKVSELHTLGYKIIARDDMLREIYISKE